MNIGKLARVRSLSITAVARSDIYYIILRDFFYSYTCVFMSATSATAVAAATQVQQSGCRSRLL